MAVRSCAGCGHPEGDHKWNRSRTNPGHGVCLTAGCACREFEEVDRMTVIERWERIAICQHPNGENVWWATDEPDPTCVQNCDCTPEVYVRAATTRGAVEDRDEMAALLTEAVRQDYGTPGWRARAIKAGCLTTSGGQ
jgi:hypothetical protein